MSHAPVIFRRCAIYTRKSAAAPFEQEVTSLETQRAICAAYITSQEHRGWTLVERPYDDAARSGSTLDRPALRALLQDVEAGSVDVVVVYKLDRITRSLADFIRLVDFFERHGTAFVSITQNFDSSDSMGRLVRNLLLIFAEFEREISRDRARDKRLLVKQSGRWTAGPAPMGYRLESGNLLVEDEEARTVRRIFELYIELERPRKIPEILAVEGRQCAVRLMANGRPRRGAVPTGASIYHILANPVYVGDIGRGDQRVRGRHVGIVDRDLFDRAQIILARRRYGAGRAPEHILQGLLRDAYGRAMYPLRNHKNKRGYFSAVARTDVPRIKALRLKADDIEGTVSGAIKTLFCDQVALRPMLLGGGASSVELDGLCRAAEPAARRLAALPSDEAQRTYALLIVRVEAGFDRVRVVLNLRAITAYLRWDGVGLFRVFDLNLELVDRHHVVEIPVQLYRRQSTWRALEPNQDVGIPDPDLLQLLSDAAAAQKRLLNRRDQTARRIEHDWHRSPGYFFRLIRLNYLAPDIKLAIIAGTHPPGLTRNMLTKAALPLDWVQQRVLLGFPALPYTKDDIEAPEEDRASARPMPSTHAPHAAASLPADKAGLAES